MSQLEQLKKAKHLKDLGRILRYMPSELINIIYSTPEEKKYKKFSILKKNGDSRQILAPNPRLKKLQRTLANLLYECFEEINLKDTDIKKNALEKNRSKAKESISHGFQRNLSIASNAKLHKNKKYVLNLDIKDFFPSINFGRIRGFFIKNENFQLNQKVATIIAQIACYENSLPQGSPCSPIISNLVAQILDRRLVKLAKKYNCVYSRYVDDLTFSTAKKIFPYQIAYEKKRSFLSRINFIKKKKPLIWVLGVELQKIIENSGFNTNLKKTRMQYKTSRQVVTGLVVNKHVNVNSNYYRYARSMCDNLFKTGAYSLPKLENQGKRTKDTTEEPTEMIPELDKLEGIINYIYYIKNYRNKFIISEPKNLSDREKKSFQKYLDENHKASNIGIKKLYSKFLYYKYFYANKAPLIFCEGKTDITYIKCALRQLKYPELIKEEEDSKTGQTRLEYLVNFFQSSHIKEDVMSLSSGTGGMKNLINVYDDKIKYYDKKIEEYLKKNKTKKDKIEEYKNNCKNFPVILVVDDDDESRGIKNKYKEQFNKNNYAHISYNLYIIILPEPNDITESEIKKINKKYKRKDSKEEKAQNKQKKKEKKDDGFAIEAYFHNVKIDGEEILDTELNGKKLNISNKSNEEFYHKSILAEYIKKNQNRIDFENFKLLLNIIVKIIKHHSSQP